LTERNIEKMSVRLRIITTGITAILVFNTLSIAAGFILFWFTASPYIGERVGENMAAIAAWYFIIGGVVVLALTGLGALWLISVTVRHVSGPLQRLKYAASQIRDGNLGYELVVSGHDEFSELSACFEQMRIRLRDSTRQKEKSETDRRAMMASVTHDLKTPITAIAGYAEGILDGVADTPEKIREYAAVINKKAKSLQSLADDLALLSRLENAQLPLNKQYMDIGAFSAEIASEFSQDTPNLQLTHSLEPGVFTLIDREKMARVLINLFQNSVKYKKPDQTIELSLSLTRQNGEALLCVSDNGVGIEKSDLPYVFDQFYRADASRGQQGGSGLGLAIARRTVNLHGGKIWIIGNPAGGITVNITLPISET